MTDRTVGLDYGDPPAAPVRAHVHGIDTSTEFDPEPSVTFASWFSEAAVSASPAERPLNVVLPLASVN